MIELEHSPLGGSSAARFMSCAYSFLKQRQEIENGTFEDIPSEFAELGVGAHELGAVCIQTRTDPYEHLNEEFNGYLAGWDDGINLDAVAVYVNEAFRILDDPTYKFYGEGRVLIEETISLPHIHPLFKGTVDLAWLSRQILRMRDYKNGEGIGVAAAGNRQLLYYAFLLIMSDPWLRDQAHRDLPVELGIVQPNFYGIYEEPDIWLTTLGHVIDWGNNELLPRMNALTDAWTDGWLEITDPDHPSIVPGSHCQFCPVLLSCPKMQQAYTEMADASEDFVIMLTNEELNRYYEMREYAQRFMKVLVTTVHARKVGGAEIPSAKLVEKKTARVWKPGGVAAIQAAFGDKAFKAREALSPAGVEKLSSRGKELALEFGYKPESNGLVVAPLSDPRPEAKRTGNETIFAKHAKSTEEMGW